MRITKIVYLERFQCCLKMSGKMYIYYLIFVLSVLHTHQKNPHKHKCHTISLFVVVALRLDFICPQGWFEMSTQTFQTFLQLRLDFICSQDWFKMSTQTFQTLLQLRLDFICPQGWFEMSTQTFQTLLQLRLDFICSQGCFEMSTQTFQTFHSFVQTLFAIKAGLR